MNRTDVVTALGRDLLNYYGDGEMDTFSDVAYGAWLEHADVLLDAMYLWFQYTVQQRGEDYVRWAVNQITSDVSTLDVDEPGSRVVFCDVMYGMIDGSFTRAVGAWQPVRDREDWPVASEVLSMVLAYMGHFIGMPQNVPTEDTA